MCILGGGGCNGILGIYQRITLFSGFSEIVRRRMATWLLSLAALAHWAVPEPVQKVFKPKNNLPVLESYSAPAPPSFWLQFPSNAARSKASMIDHVKLWALAVRTGLADRNAREICDWIQHGASVGCKEPFRGPTRSKNAATAVQYGRQVTDAVATWVRKGFVRGPVDLAEIPASAKVNGIMCRPKPDGSVRVILNMSAPAGSSVNDGINSDDFPAIMSSTYKWLTVLNLVGIGCLIMKMDWSDAYKHVPVCGEDLDLQWFEWLGMGFQELCLIFGTSSSVGIYDRVAKLVLAIVLAICKFPREWVCQHLDDVCAAAPASSDLLRQFENTYRKVAHQVGVQLAPTEDPDKAFSACTSGTVLGVHYDTVNWTWKIPEDKLVRLLNQIRGVVAASTITRKELESLTGRILHYAPLVPTGKFNSDKIIGAAATDGDTIPVTEALRRQLKFWDTVTVLCHNSTRIPDPDLKFPAWTIEVYTDAAGGSLEGIGRGCGIVAGEHWLYLQWPRKINCGVKAADGKKLSRKLSALELIGPLAAITAGHKWAANAYVRIWVDNAGSVQIWKKGYSTHCSIANTAVKALATVAAGIGCRVTIEKIRRCSHPAAKMADALSKGDFRAFWALADSTPWELFEDPMVAPAKLLAWVANPGEDDDLGQQLLEGIAHAAPVLGYNV